MQRTTICCLVALVTTVPVAMPLPSAIAANPGSPRIIRLALEPSPVQATGKSRTLLPSPETLTDADGAALYRKAVEAMPQDLDTRQLLQWVKMPLGDLPQAQVQAILEQAGASLEYVRQAVLCKSCNWPPFTPGTLPPNLSDYRQLAALLCLQARLAVTQKQYDVAIDTLGTGLAMGKQIGEAPTVVQGLVGVAVAALTLGTAQDVAQASGSPNLHAAFKALPRPLIDLEKPMSNELNALESNPQYNALIRGTMRRQMEEGFKRVRQLMYRLDSDVAASQCIEALRHYAATHDRQLPAQFGDITGLDSPNDPTTGKPFAYRRSDAIAVLDISAPKGGRPKDAVRYEISIAP